MPFAETSQTPDPESSIDRFLLPGLLWHTETPTATIVPTCFSEHLDGSCLVLTAGDGYSLEEARKKREQDKLLAAADAKKRGVRAYVQELRTYAPARLCNIVFWF